MKQQQSIALSAIIAVAVGMTGMSVFADGVSQPTLTEADKQAGDPIALTIESFPEATAVAIPFERRFSIAAWTTPGGFSSQFPVMVGSLPKLRFVDAIFGVKLGSFCRSKTRSRPFAISESKAPIHGASPGNPPQSESWKKVVNT